MSRQEVSEQVDAVQVLAMAEALEETLESVDPADRLRVQAIRISGPTEIGIHGSSGLSFHFRARDRSPHDWPVAVEFDLPEEGEQEGEDGELPGLGGALATRGTCRCFTFSRQGGCPHVIAASQRLLDELGRRSPDEVIQWIQCCLPKATDQSESLLNLLEAWSQQAAVSELPSASDSRIVWRLRLMDHGRLPIAVTPVEQRRRKNSQAWSRGQRLQAHDLAPTHGRRLDGRDSPIAAHLMEHERAFLSPGYGVWRAVSLMVDHPHVEVEAQGNVVSATVERHPLRIEVRESDHGYRLVPRVGPTALNAPGVWIAVGTAGPSEWLLVCWDSHQRRLVISPIQDPRTSDLVRQLLNPTLREIEIVPEHAARLVAAASRLDSLVTFDYPESLAGPLEPLGGELSVVLARADRGGLGVELRKHDPRIGKLLLPGFPPELIPVAGPDGPARLQRDAQAEIRTAETLAGQLQLGELPFEGEYRWTAPEHQACQLLERLAPLEAEGLEVLWPDGGQMRVAGEITPERLQLRVEDHRDWFGLSGSISLEGGEISLIDLLAALREGDQYVRIGEGVFAKLQEEFRRRLQELADVAIQERGTLKVSDVAVPHVRDLVGEDVPLETTARWRQSLEQLEKIGRLNPRPPKALNAKLRPYQREGYRWLARLSTWGVGACLADDMGLGKTVQALGVLLDRAPDGPTLIVAPTSVGDNWCRETLRFAPDLQPRLYRSEDRQQVVDAAGPGDLLITSYAMLHRDAERFASRPWNTLVLDEAQYIKNSQTKTAQAVRQIDASWRLALSGTPLENHLGELWSLFRAISPGLLGSWERFRTRFAEPIERHRDDQRRESLARLVQPFILRRTKDKVLTELPPRTEMNRVAQLSSAERKKYDATRLAALADLAGESGKKGQESEGQRRMRVLMWLTRLRQLACHPALVDKSWKRSSAKLDLLMELIEELQQEGHRALVFSQFVQHLRLVREGLDARGVPYQYLDGSTPAAERQRRVDAFQQGDAQLFLISLKAGGTGLNLTGADYVLHLDPWWNPAVEDQATDRAHRIGQSRPVTVYRLVAEGTIEEQILALHADKRKLVASILDGTDRAGRMSTDEMIRMIRGGSS